MRRYVESCDSWKIAVTQCVSTSAFQSRLVRLDIGAREDLNWWRFSLYGWNGNVLVKKLPTLQLVTDASPSGYGATSLGKQASEFWTPFIAPKCTRNDGYFDGNSCIWTAFEKQSHTDCDGQYICNGKYISHGRSEPSFSIN